MTEDIYSMTLAGLQDLCRNLGEPSFRARQIYKWTLMSVPAGDMTNIPAATREKLSQSFPRALPKMAAELRSKLDGTSKYLWSLHGGGSVESAMMEYRHGNTVCISTQAGCRMGCAFCASAKLGFGRNLLPSEMLAQVNLTAKASGKPVRNVVLMGVGEPLDNMENVIWFLEFLGDGDGPNIGMRHVTLSTCGPRGRITELAERKLQITLSVSLHAPDDALRSSIMPINRQNGIEALLDECGYYFKKTGRRVSFEYAMMAGINDGEENARKLAGLLGRAGHVNLIPLNPVPGGTAAPSGGGEIERFRGILERSGVNVTVRRRLGSDIDAACGQLRRMAAD